MISENIKHINSEIQSVCGGGKVTVVAAVKHSSLSQINEAISCGITDIGENTVQDYLNYVEGLGACQTGGRRQVDDTECTFDTRLRKLDARSPYHTMHNPSSVNFHFIGRLQTNKIKYLLQNDFLIHSGDRLSLFGEVNKIYGGKDKTAKMLLQVNVSKEQSKAGFYTEELDEVLSQIINFKNIALCGMMTMLPLTADENIIYDLALQSKAVYDKIKSKLSGFDILSMGMSEDYKICVKCGSNMVRIGRAIFNE